MTIAIPSTVKAEHDELHAELAEATRAGGRTGEAAKVVAKLMHPHFLAEEEFALPPLGLLGPLAASSELGGAEAAEAVPMTERLRAELPRMLAEHRAIVDALGVLATAASGEGKPDVALFARRLIQHATLEEQVMYPAALLVGDRIRSMRHTTASPPSPDVARFDVVAELERMRATEPSRAAGHLAKTLLRSANLRLVLITMNAGARIAAHRTEGATTIHLVDGRARLQCRGKTLDLTPGTLVSLDHDAAHDLEAVDKSGVLLSIAWSGHHAQT